MKISRKNFVLFLVMVILLIATCCVLFQKHFNFLGEEEKTFSGYVTFWFDDGMLSTYENAYPVLKNEKLPGVLAVIGNRDVALKKYKDVDSVVSWEQVLELQNEGGWEISSHTFSHLHLNDTNDPEILIYEIKKSKEFLTKKNLKISSFTYPYGERGSEETQKLVDENYSYSRASINGVNAVPASKQLKSHFYNSDTTDEELQSWIEEAENTNGWLILGLHSTIQNPVTKWEHTPKQFKKLVKAIKSSNLKVVLPSEMFNNGKL